jgi:hypothetical protein
VLALGVGEGAGSHADVAAGAAVDLVTPHVEAGAATAPRIARPAAAGGVAAGRSAQQTATFAGSKGSPSTTQKLVPVRSHRRQVARHDARLCRAFLLLPGHWRAQEHAMCPGHRVSATAGAPPVSGPVSSPPAARATSRRGARRTISLSNRSNQRS